MAEKRKSIDAFTGAAVILIIAAVLYFAYVFMMGIKAPTTTYNYGLGQFRAVNSGAISAIEGLSACGNWPLSGTDLSADRGNPFAGKTTVVSSMAATSSVLCLPVTK